MEHDADVGPVTGTAERRSIAPAQFAPTNELRDVRVQDAIFGRVAEPVALGRMLKAIRIAQGMSLSDVRTGEMAGLPLLTESDVAAIEAGTCDSLRTIQRVLDALDYSIAIAPRL